MAIKLTAGANMTVQMCRVKPHSKRLEIGREIEPPSNSLLADEKSGGLL